jgi:cytochrome c-type biogenesis protein CcmH
VFWTITAALLFAAALTTLYPMLRQKSLWSALALALIFLLPAATFWMYHLIGTPEAIHLAPPRAAATAPASAETHSPDSGQMDTMIDGLRSKLLENPEDLEGWMLLARTLRATQRFPEALEALELANRLSPGNPFIMVDMVETQIYTTPEGRITPEMTATLIQALEMQPDLQKAMWLLGIAAAQNDDDATALTYWEALLEQAEPGTGVSESVQAQIDEAKARMGATMQQAPAVQAPSVPVDTGAWSGIRVSVSAGEASSIPQGGVLYVVIRSPGPAMGPPIGVRRIIGPQLPLEMTISDQDSMMKERQISAESEVQLQARISLTGSPGAQTGDWQSEQVTVTLDSAKNVELVIDQRVE